MLRYFYQYVHFNFVLNNLLICKSWIPFYQECFVARLVGKFLYYLPFQKDGTLYIIRLEFYKDSRYPILLRLVKWGSGEVLKIRKCIFLIIFFFVYIPLKRGGLFIWTNLNLLQQRMLEKELAGTWQFHYFFIIILGQGQDPLYNRSLIPFHHNDLCQVWLHVTKSLWRRIFWHFVNVYSIIC